MAIPTDDFNSIVIWGDAAPDAISELVDVKSLRVPFVPDLDRYRTAEGEAKQEYFIAILKDGLHRAHEFHPLPLSRMLPLVDDFKAGRYRNNWTHQSKLLRGFGVRATLDCELTMEAFRLTLTVSQQDQLLWSEVILSTLPDETCFHYRFKDIVVSDSDLVVSTRRWPEPELFRAPLREILDERA
ncbi:MAG: hypothetical protein QF672_08790 [SAR202 cluster bacterium]|nr:hypothetical protein [SAR202 cluster bacterium]